MNKTKIKITGTTLVGTALTMYCEKVFMLRTARKVGDVEIVSNTVLGKLNDNALLIQYEKI